MDKSIEKLVQQIGQEAGELAMPTSRQLLIYAEVEDDVVSADLFYLQSQLGRVRHQFCSESLHGLIYRLWSQWKAVPGNTEWRTMEYAIIGDDLSMKFTYPNEVEQDEDVSDRRPRIIEKHFGATKVDYSLPD